MRNKGWQSFFLPCPLPNPHKLQSFYTPFLCRERSLLAISQHLTLQNPQRRQTPHFCSLGKDTIDPLSLMINSRMKTLKYTPAHPQICQLRSETVFLGPDSNRFCPGVSHISSLPGRGWACRSMCWEQKGPEEVLAQLSGIFVPRASSGGQESEKPTRQSCLCGMGAGFGWAGVWWIGKKLRSSYWLL